MFSSIFRKLIRVAIFFIFIYLILRIFSANILKFTIDYALFKMENSKEYKIESYSLDAAGDQVVLSNLNFEKSGIYFSSNKVTFVANKFNIFSVPELYIDELAVIIDNKDVENENMGSISTLFSLIPGVHINKLLVTSYFMSDKIQNILLSNVNMVVVNNIELSAEKVFFNIDNKPSNSSYYFSMRAVASREKNIFHLYDRKNSIKLSLINNKPDNDFSLEVNLSEDFNKKSILGLLQVFAIDSVDLSGEFFLKSSANVINHDFRNFVISSKIIPYSIKLNGNNENILVEDMSRPDSKGNISWYLTRDKMIDIRNFDIPFLSGRLNLEKSVVKLSDDELSLLKGELSNIDLAAVFADKKIINKALFSGFIELNPITNMMNIKLKANDNSFLAGEFSSSNKILNNSSGKMAEQIFYLNEINLSSFGKNVNQKGELVQLFSANLFGSYKKDSLPNKRETIVSNYEFKYTAPL